MADVFEAAFLKHADAGTILRVACSRDTAKRKMPAGKLQNRGQGLRHDALTPFRHRKHIADLGFFAAEAQVDPTAQRGLVQFSNNPTYAFPVGRLPFERSKALGDLGYALHGTPVHVLCNARIGCISVEQRSCILDRQRSQL